MPAGGNKPYQRASNRSHVLDALRRNPGVSRRDLASMLGLDRSTITLITAELLEQGLLDETGTVSGGTGRGRPTVGLRIRDERLRVLGIALHAGGYRAVVRDNAGTIHARLEGRHSVRGAGKAEFAALLAEIYQSAGSGMPVIGIGCAIPGSVDSTTPAVLYSRELEIRSVKLPRYIQVNEALQIPVVFDNDARCGAWGELHYRNTETASLMFVTAQKQASHFGVGMGIVSKGSVISGVHHTSGEFYSPDWQGDERSQFSLPYSDLARIGSDRAVTDAVFAEIVRGLVPAASVLDPEALVFGGFLREHYTQLIEVARGIPAAASIMRLFAPGSLESDEFTSGAAGMFHEHLFDVPGFTEEDSARSIGWDAITKILGAA